MSFQSYLDNIEERTGRSPKDLIKEAKSRGFDKPGTKAGEILSWLKEEYDLGRGHGMAIVHIIRKGDAISEKHVNSGGVHSDPSSKLNLKSKKK